MNAGMWFWIIYIIFWLFGGYLGYSSPPERRGFVYGGFVLLVLVGLLGWGIFGPPIR